MAEVLNLSEFTTCCCVDENILCNFCLMEILASMYLVKIDDKLSNKESEVWKKANLPKNINWYEDKKTIRFEGLCFEKAYIFECAREAAERGKTLKTWDDLIDEMDSITYFTSRLAPDARRRSSTTFKSFCTQMFEDPAQEYNSDHMPSWKIRKGFTTILTNKAEYLFVKGWVKSKNLIEEFGSLQMDDNGLSQKEAPAISKAVVIPVPVVIQPTVKNQINRRRFIQFFKSETVRNGSGLSLNRKPLSILSKNQFNESVNSRKRVHSSNANDSVIKLKRVKKEPGLTDAIQKATVKQEIPTKSNEQDGFGGVQNSQRFLKLMSSGVKFSTASNSPTTTKNVVAVKSVRKSMVKEEEKPLEKIAANVTKEMQKWANHFKGDVLTMEHEKLKLLDAVDQVKPPVPNETWCQIVRGGFNYKKKVVMDPIEMDQELQTKIITSNMETSLEYKNERLTMEDLKEMKSFSIIEEEGIDYENKFQMPIENCENDGKVLAQFHWSRNFITKFHVDACGMTSIMALSPDCRGYKVWIIEKIKYDKIDLMNYGDFKFDDDKIVLVQKPGDILFLSPNCIHEVYTIGEVWGVTSNYKFSSMECIMECLEFSFLDEIELQLQKTIRTEGDKPTLGHGINPSVSFEIASWLLQNCEELERIDMEEDVKQVGWFDPIKLFNEKLKRPMGRMSLARLTRKENSFTTALAILTLNTYFRYDKQPSQYHTPNLPLNFDTNSMYQTLLQSLSWIGGIEAFVRELCERTRVQPPIVYAMLNVPIANWNHHCDYLWSPKYEEIGEWTCPTCKKELDHPAEPSAANVPDLSWCQECQTVYRVNTP